MQALLAFAVLGWAFIALSILAHRLFVSNDAISNYAHVWYAADALWNHGTIPYRMRVINGGDGLAFPYAAPVWLVGAVLWPLVGEWGVTLLLVLGGAACLLAAVAWRPALRDPVLLTLFLLNPAFIEAVVLAQLPFLWATTTFFLAARALERRRWVTAALLLALTQGIHPAVLSLPVVVLVLYQLWRGNAATRRRLVAVYAVSLVLSAPAFWTTLATPALVENNPWLVLLNYVTTLAARVLLLLAPPVLAHWAGPLRRRSAAACMTLLLLSVTGMISHRDMWAFKQLVRGPDTVVARAVAAPWFEPGAVYRVLDGADGKVSLYRTVRAGGVLEGDFFPESLERRSFASVDAYRAFLDRRGTEYVIITAAYDRDEHTNEHDLLRTMAARGGAEQVYTDGLAEAYRVGDRR